VVSCPFQIGCPFGVTPRSSISLRDRSADAAPLISQAMFTATSYDGGIEHPFPSWRQLITRDMLIIHRSIIQLNDAHPLAPLIASLWWSKHTVDAVKHLTQHGRDIGKWRHVMPSFTFTGNQSAVNGTSLNVLDGMTNAGGATYYLGNPGYQDYLGVGVATADYGRYVNFNVFTDEAGHITFTSFTAHSAAPTILSGTGFYTMLGVASADIEASQGVAALNAQLSSLFQGNDSFDISGAVSSIWGDFQLTPTGTAARQFGDDYFFIHNVSLATGSSSISIFGDAQFAVAGVNSLAGDDMVDGRNSTVALSIFGDFQSVSGSVTYGNDTLHGGAGADAIYGDSPSSTNAGGNDYLVGYGGNDTLIGGGGTDRLYGGAGADIVDGGVGFDTALFGVLTATVLVVDLLNSANNTEEALGDTYAGIEALQGRDFASTYGNDDLRGNDSDNTLLGLGGADILSGRGGSDWLDGGAGIDTLNGGLGNDTYIVDNASDSIVESVGGGTDRLFASATYSLAAGVEVETLATINAALATSINLIGNGFGQTLIGNAGLNNLVGGGGNDILRGLGGNDNYFVDSQSDIIDEVAGGGTADRVYTTTTFALAADDNIEFLATTNGALTTAINLAGNALSQTITGNAGANVIYGGLGNDTLLGLGGSDSFVFNTAPSAGNVETLSDFNVADSVWLENAVYTGLTGLGTLTANQFVANTTGLAATATQHIIYETDTGNLFYDSNGNAAGGSVLLAHLSAGLALTNADFVII